MKKNKVLLTKTGDTYNCRYVLDQTDIIDEKVDKGVSGKFPQIIPCRLEEKDNQREFIYEIGNKVQLTEFLKKEINKKQMLTLLYNLLSGLEAFGMNMISLSYVAKDIQYVFVAPESLNVYFIVAGVDKEITDLNEVRNFVKDVICNAHYFEMDRDNYVARLITFTNKLGTFSVGDMKEFVNQLLIDMGIHIEEEKKKTEKKQDKRDLLNVADILEFAEIVDIKEIEEVIGRQIAMNTAISEEGLRNHYGAEVGRTLLRAYGDDVKVRARAKAAAGSDARMNGCSMPVVINSGSGNQGMTCSLPVIEYARELNVPKEKMYRALVVSNLVAIHQKNYIGSLSAYCGAVSAACGAGAAISWLNGGDYNAISKTITNALANTSGIVCDGAKSSCAAKIASAVDAAIMAYALEDADHCFQAGEGLVRDNVEDTIRNMGYVGRVGMKDTDVTILNLMIDQKKV